MFLQFENNFGEWRSDIRERLVRRTEYFLKQFTIQGTSFYNLVHQNSSIKNNQTDSNPKQCAICFNNRENELERGNISTYETIFYSITHFLNEHAGYDTIESQTDEEKDKEEETLIFDHIQRTIEFGWICRKYNGLLIDGNKNTFNSSFLHLFEFNKSLQILVKKVLYTFNIDLECIDLILSYLDIIQPANLQDKLPFQSNSEYWKKDFRRKYDPLFQIATLYYPKTVQDGDEIANATMTIYEFIKQPGNIIGDWLAEMDNLKKKECIVCGEQNPAKLVWEIVSCTYTLFNKLALHVYDYCEDDYNEPKHVANEIKTGKWNFPQSWSSYWLEGLLKSIKRDLQKGWICQNWNHKYYLVDGILRNCVALHTVDFYFKQQFNIKDYFENYISLQYTLFDLNLISIVLEYLPSNLQLVKKYNRLLQTTFRVMKDFYFYEIKNKLY